MAKMEIESVTKDNIPIAINNAIQALRKAKTFHEKEEAIKSASSVIDAFEVAKKFNSELEEKLEEARREIIKAIIDVKIKRVRKYDRAKGKDVHGQGRSKKQNEKTPEGSGVSEKPKQNEMNISSQNLSEDRKVSNLERKHPGLINKIIDSKPKKETVSRNIGFKAAKYVDKHDGSKEEDIMKIFIEESNDKTETRRYQEDMRKRRETIQENKPIHAIVREYEQNAINGLDKAKIAIERITEIIKVNDSIVLSESLILTLNKWRYFLGELHKIYPFDNTYDPEQKTNNELIIIDR